MKWLFSLNPLLFIFKNLFTFKYTLIKETKIFKKNLFLIESSDILDIFFCISSFLSPFNKDSRKLYTSEEILGISFFLSKSYRFFKIFFNWIFLLFFEGIKFINSIKLSIIKKCQYIFWEFISSKFILMQSGKETKLSKLKFSNNCWYIFKTLFGTS